MISANLITHAVIEPTSRCNFRCGFCAGRHMEQGDMDLHNFISVLNQLPKLKYLYLSGEGEGLLNRSFIKMAEIAFRRKVFQTLGYPLQCVLIFPVLRRFELQNLWQSSGVRNRSV